MAKSTYENAECAFIKKDGAQQFWTSLERVAKDKFSDLEINRTMKQEEEPHIVVVCSTASRRSTRRETLRLSCVSCFKGDQFD